PMAPEHCLTPFLQVSVPALHWHLPTGMFGPQVWPHAAGVGTRSESLRFGSFWSVRKLQSLSLPSHTSAGKVQAITLQSPGVLAGSGHWYSQPITLMSPLAGLCLKVAVPGVLLQALTWHTPAPLGPETQMLVALGSVRLK